MMIFSTTTLPFMRYCYLATKQNIKHCSPTRMTSYRVCFVKIHQRKNIIIFFTDLKLRKPLDFHFGSAANHYAGVVRRTVSHHRVFWETKDTEEAADFQSFSGSISNRIKLIIIRIIGVKLPQYSVKNRDCGPSTAPSSSLCT